VRRHQPGQEAWCSRRKSECLQSFVVVVVVFNFSTVENFKPTLKQTDEARCPHAANLASTPCPTLYSAERQLTQDLVIHQQ
jgi:hypothetical protein